MRNVLSVKMNFLIMEKWDKPPTGISNFLQPIQLFSPEGFCSRAFLKVDSHTFVGPDYTSRHVRVVSSGGAWVSKIALLLGKNRIIPSAYSEHWVTFTWWNNKISQLEYRVRSNTSCFNVVVAANFWINALPFITCCSRSLILMG